MRLPKMLMIRITQTIFLTALEIRDPNALNSAIELTTKHFYD